MLDLDSIQHRFDTFRSLMASRVREILLVSSVYDAYIIEEDGTLEERIWQQYADRGLSTVPRIRKVSSVERALETIRTERIDLVLAIVHEETELAFDLAREVKALRKELPVVVLATDPATLPQLEDQPTPRVVDRVFLWQNDPTLLVAIIKYIEDLANADHDARAGGVRLVLLVEDSIAHYSAFLPAIYTAIMEMTRRLIDEGLNHLHRQLRMRSRAKILLAGSFEEALHIYRRYQPYILGVISDVRFMKAGRMDDDAGFELLRLLRREMPELPVCIQSAEPEKNRGRAEALHAFFVDKNSSRIVEDLQRFLRETMGFGEFIFRMRDGRELARAGNPRELLEALRTVPAESILHHAEHQHFSHWMMARTEVRIAEQLYPRRAEDFENAEALRQFLIRTIGNVLDEKQSDIITRFMPGRNPLELQFMRWGEGSLGGKARGIGFLRYLLSRLEVRRLFPDLAIQIPPSLVVCSSEFARFLEDNRLWDLALKGRLPFPELQQRFLKGKLREEMVHDLRSYLQTVREPLAVRSSSILEDSLNLPLAGLYSTYMLPNSDRSLDERLASLLAAVKLVWASTFGDNPRAYFRQTSYRLEDERMAVVVQTLGGCRRGDHFYPTFSGVAQSHNFYPVSYMKPEDGVAQIALGLGKTVVEGGPIVRFCPRYPLLAAAVRRHARLAVLHPEELLRARHGPHPRAARPGHDGPPEIAAALGRRNPPGAAEGRLGLPVRQRAAGGQLLLRRAAHRDLPEGAARPAPEAGRAAGHPALDLRTRHAGAGGDRVRLRPAGGPAPRVLPAAAAPHGLPAALGARGRHTRTEAGGLLLLDHGARQRELSRDPGPGVRQARGLRHQQDARDRARDRHGQQAAGRRGAALRPGRLRALGVHRPLDGDRGGLGADLGRQGARGGRP